MKYKIDKYQFGGEEDLSSSAFFSTVANYLSGINQQPQESYAPEAIEQDDEADYTEEDYQELLDKYNSLSSDYEALQGQQPSSNLYSPEFNDSFLNFLFQPDTANKPLAFSDEDLYPVAKAPSTNKASNLYEAAQQYKGMSYGFGSTGSGNKIDCSGYVCKVLNVPRTTSEGLLTGSSNFRQYSDKDSLTEGTVVGFDMGAKSYDKGRKHGIDHVAVVIKNPQTGQLELSESTSGKGVISRPLNDALNNYKKRAKSIYIGEYQLGGKVARTPDELFKGLNDSTFKTMTLDLPKAYNMIRGLDSGKPVYVQDETGKKTVLHGPQDVIPMYGKVFEKRLGGNYEIDKPCNC